MSEATSGFLPEILHIAFAHPGYRLDCFASVGNDGVDWLFEIRIGNRKNPHPEEARQRRLEGWAASKC
jgi:hypothetical protein